MSDTRKESQIVIAMEEIKAGRTKSVYVAAKDFGVLYSTLTDCLNGITWIGDQRNNAILFSLSEEDAIV